MTLRAPTKQQFDRGRMWIWFHAGAVSISLIMVIGLILLIAIRGLSHFWPAELMELSYAEPGYPAITLVGEQIEREAVSARQLAMMGVPLAEGQETVYRSLLKVGNRDYYGLDFRWINEFWIEHVTYPASLITIERREWGNIYGYLVNVKQDGEVVVSGEQAWDALQARLQWSNAIHQQIRALEKNDIGKINHAIEQLRLERRRLELNQVEQGTKPYLALEEMRQQLDKRYVELQSQRKRLYQELERDQITVSIAGGHAVELPLSTIVQAWQPNAMNGSDKLKQYFRNLWGFVSGEPREANTEGGIFPAIFGTVVMVMLMSVLVTPLGVIAAIYLKEYAKQGLMVRLIRIAVNNLAGVPSIVYGIFGLGFFVYFVGGTIDDIFFQTQLPSPTFGAPGLLWASITLALLTLPVVIVATEEGLSRIPREIREGSLALGATKAETLWRTVLPMAVPAIMTGLILAVARAAGEVAPLMMVGAVKLAPALAVDTIQPYLHLDRQFMHLGFHIYDVGFQSPNVEAARPLVYATAFLLVFIIVVLNLAAISIRNRLREKYKASES